MADQYAGDVLPKDAWAMLAAEPKAVLVDVRTVAEWNFVGVPDLHTVGKEPIYASWVLFPTMAPNPNFSSEVGSAVADKDTPIFFLCRTGGRSKAAAIAMTAQGYQRCYNILNGFEGDKDPANHRSSVSGWRADQLPWAQS